MTSANPLLRVLERMGFGAVFVNGAGHILSFNLTVKQIVAEFIENNVSTETELREGFKKLITSDGNRFRLDSESWVVLSRKDKKALAIYAIPMGEGKDSYEKSLIVVVDLERKSGPSYNVLRKMFKLSSAESAIALQLLEGKTLQEIAEGRGISQWTVRTQLASVFNKTKTRRQSDLVSLLLRISILP